MNVDRTVEAAHAVQRIDDLADLITPMAIRVAAALRLADHVHGGARTIEELAQRTGTHAPSLAALVGHLVSVGVFAQATDGALTIARLGKQLRVAQRYLDAENSVGRAELSLVQLLETVRTGEPAYPLHFGTTFWQDMAGRPAMRATFDAMTDRHLDAEFEPLLAAFDWESSPHIVDLGAGNGELLARLLSRLPQLRATIVDLPGNTAAQRNVERAGVADRCQIIGGDFFESMTYLPRATLVLASVLHDWNDADTAAILRRCREALHPDECLLVIDSFTDGANPDSRMDLRMLALFGGRQRTLSDMAAIADGAGLPVVRSQRLRKKWLLELRQIGDGTAN